MYLYEYKYSELPASMQELIDDSEVEPTGYKPETFTCLNCGSMEIMHWDNTEKGDFIYRCEDCESLLSEDDLDLV